MKDEFESMILMDEWSFFNVGWLWFDSKQQYYKSEWNNKKYDDDYRRYTCGSITGKEIAYELVIDNMMHWLLPRDDNARSRFKWCIRHFIKRQKSTTKRFEEALYEYFLRG